MSTTAPMISDIFHYAADHCLWDGKLYGVPYFYRIELHSCDAIYAAIEELTGSYYDEDSLTLNLELQIVAGLKNLGLDQRSTCLFDDVESGEQRQGARYAWLKFCAMMAEEQGV